MAPGASLEERLTIVEAEIAELQKQVKASQPMNWLEQITGSFKDEPAFDEALAYGRAIRQGDDPLLEEQDELFKPVAARYLADVRSLEIEFENGSSYRYPVDRLDFSRWDGSAYVPLEPRPTDADLEAVVIWPNGEIVEFENIDQGFEVARLISELIS